jgi:hypothetical protein
MKAGLFQLIPHDHSGRLRHHSHTSYAGLGFLLLLCGFLLLGFSFGTDAATPAVNPQSGSVGLTGVVKGPPPTEAAVITSPRNGQHTSTIPITVSGSCPAGTFVQITKNGVFAGAATCGEDGTFSLQVDLFDGQNLLLARVSDALGQFGPDSAVVTVFYDAPSLNLQSGGVGRQLFLETTTTVQGMSPGQTSSRSVTSVGGVGPYAVSWDWGDGTNSLVSQQTEGTTTASHSYERPGNYRVIIRVTDGGGNSAFLQVVTVVNGALDSLGASGGTGKAAFPGLLITAWPLYVLALVMVIVFWLGERREEHKLRRKGLLYH